MHLDEYQLPFCQSPKRALRLLAPAGSGKTHSLLLRCLHQWRQAGAPKPRFLLFAFTRAARDELRDRMQQDGELGDISGSVEVATLNAWGYRRLRARTHNLRLVTTGGQIHTTVHNTLQPVWNRHPRIKEILTEARARGRVAKVIMAVTDGLKSLGFRHDRHHQAGEFVKHLDWLRKAGLGNYFSGLLQMLVDSRIIDSRQPNLTLELEENFLGFWHDAVELMRQSAVITLEDQKYLAWLDLEESIAEGNFTTGVHRCDHILVDEFQDVNCLDLRLLQAIAALNKAELAVVGDDDQAIYEWRGASPEFILRPDEYVGHDVETHILSRNYRSPRNIVQLSQRLIRHNQRRVDKEIIPDSEVDAKLEILKMSSLSETIDWVVGEVKAMLDSGDIGKVALIGRKRGQIIPYQIVFASHNIPFYAAEDLQVFLGDAFRAIQGILAIKARVIARPAPGINPVQDLLMLCDKVRRYPLNKTSRAALLQHLQSAAPETFFDAVKRFLKYTGPLGGGNADGRITVAFFNAIYALIKADSIAETIRVLSADFQGLQRDYGRSLEDIFYADPPFLHLGEFAERYGDDYDAFNRDIDRAVGTLALVPDDADAVRNPEWRLPLHLMTALRAKGKEFDTVILLDVNKDIWPSVLAVEPDQLEQERRVFYVAMTRAKKRLVMLVNESMLGSPALPSPYLSEMGIG